MDEITIALLDLRRRHQGEWRIWRTHADPGREPGWVATNRVPGSPWAPTLHADTLAELAEQLERPPTACGRVISPEQRAALLAEVRAYEPVRSTT
jgi:hypothetical protein